MKLLLYEKLGRTILVKVLKVVKKNCLESDLKLEKEEILILSEMEFEVLTPCYKKDCCSFVLFINGIVNMREVQQLVGR